MAIRAEESVWFDGSYIGSRAALGRLPRGLLEVRRSDTGLTLRHHMAEAGFDPDAVERGRAYLRPEAVRGYIEVHIEQGPVLVEQDVPIGLVTAVRGCLRFADAHCFGRYAHSGAEPRRHRQDAVLATVRLINALQEESERLEAEGGDIAFTVGVLNTDPGLAGPSKVAGETRFALDIRSVSDRLMRRMERRVVETGRVIARTHGVRFDFGKASYSPPALMHESMRSALGDLARDLSMPFIEMPSGAGHDAVVFAEMGVPSAMIFIRNRGGSHNAAEEMDLADFAAAARLLAAYVEMGA
jgi:N-carbamoyl-L-amino-acid hydrolase